MFATALLIEPKHRSFGSALLLAAGVALIALVLIALVRPPLLARSLIAQGLVISGLGLGLMVDTISWAATAPPLSMFRYAPGAIVLAITYGTLQVAAFCMPPGRATSLRRAGLIAGSVLELVAAGFVVRRFLS